MSDWKIPTVEKKRFRKKILNWSKDNLRDYPWRKKRNPYKVLISEILLTRTKAKQVVPVYNEFMERYPNVRSILNMKFEIVAELIKSLGLAFRADMLKTLSEQLKNDYNKKIPGNVNRLKKLRGVGNYCANAVLCFGMGKKRAILDANFIRIYKRVFGIRPKTKTAKSDKYFWGFAETMLPKKKYVEYNYGILDLGGYICKNRNPECNICPVNEICKKYNKSL